ncbi:MAG: helix-turn-helix transcriptional regulator [Nitrosomonadales bacterium]|nr:helix-turn-helix transcriptional regulator [Nitrosomonadales bacterium]
MKNKVRAYRLQRELSQQQLADELSVSRQTINSIETEKYEPSLQMAFRLAKYFGVKIEELFRP